MFVFSWCLYSYLHTKIRARLIRMLKKMYYQQLGKSKDQWAKHDCKRTFFCEDASANGFLMETASYNFYSRNAKIMESRLYVACYSSWNPYFSCDFETSTQGGNIYSMKGPYLSHSATSKLVLNIKRLGEPLVQISTASNSPRSFILLSVQILKTWKFNIFVKCKAI